MEQVAGPEIRMREVQGKDQLRKIQRGIILQNHIKKPSEKELLNALIPSDRQRPDTAVDAAYLRQFSELLGKDTHTVLFGLAATSNNPKELQNILFNIASLKKVKSSYWNFEESEDHFLRRKLPKHIGVSEEAGNKAEAIVAYGTTIDSKSDPQYLLESILYSISADVPPEEKKRIMRDFYNAKALMSAPFGKENHQEIYGSESSFWSHVDGSWIDPDLAPVSTPKTHGQPKKPSIASTVAKDIKGRLDRLAEEITQAPQITTLEKQLNRSNANIARFTKDVQGLERQLGSKNIDVQRLQTQLEDEQASNKELQGRLREAQLQQGQTKSPFEILGIDPSATPEEIRETYRRIISNLQHPQSQEILQTTSDSMRPATVSEINNLIKARVQDVDHAMEQLRQMGKLQPPTPAPRPPGPEVATAARVEPPKPQEVKPLPHNVTAEMLGLRSDLDVELVGMRNNEDGFIYGYNTFIKATFNDGSQHICRSTFEGGKWLLVKLEDGGRLATDQIVSYRIPDPKLSQDDPKSYDNAIDIPVWNKGETQPREPAPAPTPGVSTPRPRDAAPAPTTAEPSESPHVKPPVVDPELERIPRDANQPDEEKVIELGTGDMEIIEELNRELAGEAGFQYGSNLYRPIKFVVPATKLKDYLLSIAQGMVKGGSIEVLPNNAILLKGVQLETKVGKATVKANVDIAMHNNENEDGIEATLLEYRSGNVATKLGGALRAFGGPSVRGEIEKELANINATVKTKLNEQIDPGFSSWTAERISISGDKVHIRFNRSEEARSESPTVPQDTTPAEPPPASSVQEAATPEKLELGLEAEAEQEPKIEVIPGTEEEKKQFGNGVRRLKINGKDTGLFWYRSFDGFNMPLRQVKEPYTFDLPNGTVFSQKIDTPDGDHQNAVAIGGKDVKVTVFPRERWSINDTRLSLVSNTNIFNPNNSEQQKALKERRGQVSIGSSYSFIDNRWIPISRMQSYVKNL